GRQEVDEALVEELRQLHRLLSPKETLLVADAATGQQAVNVAKTFDGLIGLTGLVLTKLDGDARGGAALSMRSVTGKPIKFAGVGEKLSDFEVFVPDRIAGRILGMGDIVGLVEKAAEAIDENEALRMAERLRKADFDFTDFLSQIRMMKRMGGLQSLIGMLPGMGDKLKGVEVDDRRMKQTEAIVLSMTPTERTRPEIIKASRRRRIAMGSGTSVTQVNQLLKQFGQMRKMMRSKGKMSQMMKQFSGGKMPF
ncbi:MAG TPA: signal recognition particle protein, partial [Bacteroidia bacterium]|nr:signal recognition particle protein [Bacteroidia bacterium]